MSDRTLKVGFAFFPYGGNGGISNEAKEIRSWIVGTVVRAKSDPRISGIVHEDFSDTPITETRNRAVLWARKNAVDVLVMVDSDMYPDYLLGRPGTKPFFESSFDFLYDRWDEGPHAVCAPYCGPPPEEPVYVFQWVRGTRATASDTYSSELIPRTQAALLTGICPVAGAPTGLMMFDMRCFDLTDPVAKKTGHGWFYYEYPDAYQAQKMSTEDWTATRDMSLVGHIELGRDVIFCNWDAWAGHWKPWLVGKPEPLFASDVAGLMKQAVLGGHDANQKRTYLHGPLKLPAIELPGPDESAGDESCDACPADFAAAAVEQPLQNKADETELLKDVLFRRGKFGKGSFVKGADILEHVAVGAD